MITNIPNLLIVIALLVLIFGYAEFLYKRQVAVHLTRKVVHIGGGIVTALLPFFVNLETVIILGIGFFLLLALSKWKNLLNSIHKVDNDSVGALLFVPSLTLVAIIFWPINPLIFQGSALVLGLSDGIAGIIGTKYGRKEYSITGKKTIEGSLTFFIITVFIMFCILYISGRTSLVMNNGTLFVLGSSLLLTIIESAFGKGWDNLFIPIVTALILYFAL